MSQNQRYNHLVIYGQGLTSKCNTITPFKKGAFSVKYPLKVEGLKYMGRIENSTCMVSIFESLVGICLNLRNRFVFLELDCLIEPAFEMPWEEYSEEVRRLMCNEFGFEYGNGDFKERNDLLDKFIGKHKKD